MIRYGRASPNKLEARSDGRRYAHALQMNARGGHFLREDLAAFDAPFFSMARAEAECMDPQHRRLLEGAYHAFENGMYITRI